MQDIQIGNVTITVKTGYDILENLKNGSYRLQVVIYGNAGCGKSRFAATFPYKCGVIDTDNGALAYVNSPHDIVTIRPDSKEPNTTPIAYTYIQAAITHFLSDPQYHGIILDSITTISDACMNHVISINKHYPGIPTLPERNAALETMKSMLSRIQSSNKHFILIAHERMDKDEMTGRIWCRPAVAGQYSASMPVYFDEVYHGNPRRTSHGIEYKFDTAQDSVCPCKSRLATVIPIGDVIDPDFSRIMRMIEAQVNTKETS